MKSTFKKYHRISGIAIAAFLLLHLTNHLFALGGPALHIKVMQYFEYIYCFPPVEIFLLLCIVFQVVSGIILLFKKSFYRQSFTIILQAASGLYLSFFMLYHVRAVMLGRYQWHVATDFYYAAGGLVNYPSKLFFIPYYSLSVISVFLHIACAHYNRRMELLPGAASPDIVKLHHQYKKEALFIGAVGLLITFLIMISFCGLLYPVNKPV